METAFPSLDRLGLAAGPHRSTRGFVLHLYSTILAYQLKRMEAFELRLLIFRIGVFNYSLSRKLLLSIY